MRPMTLVSLLVAGLVAVAALAGLLADVYPTGEESFATNDLVNLAVVLPVLLGGMWSARRGQLLGRLLWMAALATVIYNTVVYVVALPVDLYFLLQLLILTVSLGAVVALIMPMAATDIQQQFRGVAPARLSGAVLAGLGLLFALRVVGIALGDDATLPLTEKGLLIADFLLAAAWITGGLLLYRREALGYIVGAGLLFQAGVLFIGVMLILLLQPLMTDSDFVAADLAVIVVMSLICFIPLALWIRGFVRNRTT